MPGHYAAPASRGAQHRRRGPHPRSGQGCRGASRDGRPRPAAHHCRPSHHSGAGEQGEFNWSSQHSGSGRLRWQVGVGQSCVAEQAAFAGTPSGRAAGAPAAFLGVDRGWCVERGRGDWRGRVGPGRSTVASDVRRHATIDACAIIEAFIWAILVVCRAGGACNPACPGRRGGGRSPGTWGGRDRRDRESYGAMLLRAAASWIIGPLRRSGMLNVPHDAPKAAKLARNVTLRTYVQDRLGGMVVAPSGAAVLGPMVSWKGRRHGRRKDRRWASAWSPEQISHRLRLDLGVSGIPCVGLFN